MLQSWFTRPGSIVAVSGVLLLSAAALIAQETKYQVVPVYPPPLKRPPAKVSRESLPKDASGILPSYDGEPFHVNLSAQRAEAVSEEQARGVVSQVLRAAGWSRSAAELPLARRVALPAAQNERLDREIAKQRQDAEKRLSGELGRLSPTTKSAPI